MRLSRRLFIGGIVLASSSIMGGATKVYAENKPSYSNVDSLDYFDRVAAFIDARFASESKKTISRITTLDDLAGNTYTLVECKPVGYFILHDASGQFAEIGEASPSPYRDSFGKLIYAGPGSYLCETAEGFVDLVNGKLIQENSTSTARQISDNASEMNERFNTTPNVGLLNVLQPSEDYIATKEISSSIIEEAERQRASVIESYVLNEDFFTEISKKYCGYYRPMGSPGICGYIAANLVYRYWNYRGKFWLHSSFTSSNGVQNGYFTQWLYNWGTQRLGLSDETSAWDIARLMNNICSYYGAAQTATRELLASNAWTEITQNRRPVSLFGLYSGAFHAFVAYGVEINTAGGNQKWICHMGKDYYNNKVHVSTSTLIGSNMKCAY